MSRRAVVHLAGLARPFWASATVRTLLGQTLEGLWQALARHCDGELPLTHCDSPETAALALAWGAPESGLRVAPGSDGQDWPEALRASRMLLPPDAADAMDAGGRAELLWASPTRGPVSVRLLEQFLAEARAVEGGGPAVAASPLHHNMHPAWLLRQEASFAARGRCLHLAPSHPLRLRPLLKPEAWPYFPDPESFCGSQHLPLLARVHGAMALCPLAALEPSQTLTQRATPVLQDASLHAPLHVLLMHYQGTTA